MGNSDHGTTYMRVGGDDGEPGVAELVEKVVDVGARFPLRRATRQARL